MDKRIRRQIIESRARALELGEVTEEPTAEPESELENAQRAPTGFWRSPDSPLANTLGQRGRW